MMWNEVFLLVGIDGVQFMVVVGGISGDVFYLIEMIDIFDLLNWGDLVCVWVSNGFWYVVVDLVWCQVCRILILVGCWVVEIDFGYYESFDDGQFWRLFGYGMFIGVMVLVDLFDEVLLMIIILNDCWVYEFI